ncbi:MAG TPA: hypothetical protein VMT71_16055 [Syntrophorhabdales bacterium]|nr:hypothetical protein [Syntrophorhabdales bacterium]
MWWYFAPFMWGFWPVFPIICFLFMMVMMLICFRFMRGHGGMCGFHREDDDRGALRKEIRELRSELQELRQSKGA